MSALLPAGPWDREQPRRRPGHTDRMRVYMAARRAAFRATGRCIDCGAPVRIYTRCLDHRLANAARVARARFKKSLEEEPR